MNKTQFKDALKNIQKQKVSFFSIVVIAAMAVAAYLGMNFASHAITDNADRFYDSMNFRDAEVVSTLLLTPEDIEALKETDGVSEAEPVWQSTGVLVKGGQSKKATVVSLTYDINVPVLISGRMPEAADECLVDTELAEQLSISDGDEVSITSAEYLKTGRFKVCGIMICPDYAVNTLAAPGNREVIVPKEAFDREALDDCSMKAVIRFEKEDGLSRFYDPYFKKTGPLMERVEALGEIQSAKRTEYVRKEYAEGIADGERKLAEAGTGLADARKKLDDGYKELADGEEEAKNAGAELEDGAKELEETWTELEDGKRRLIDGEKELKDAELELADARSQLDDGEKELDQAQRELASGRKELDRGWNEYYENAALLEDAKEQLEKGRQELDDGEKKLADAGAELEDARKTLDQGWEEYEKNEELLNDAGEQLDEGRAQLEEGDKELADAKAELDAGRKKLDDGWQEYYLNETILANSKIQLDEGKKLLEEGERAQ
ncbi:MAG: hypothetical protein K6E62_05325 [Lachnospiraceae bacterium]|nr:hypothetical protein [Lachnospiraceae bacterium]